MKKLLIGLVFISLAAAQTRYSVLITRPANATAYTAGDVVCGSDSLPSLLIGKTGHLTGKITSIEIVCDTANAANGTFTLFLYGDSLNLGKIADNAANTASLSSDSLLIGAVAFTLVTTGTASGTVAYHSKDAQSIPFIQANSIASGRFQQRGIWGRLAATGAWVPKISGKIRITAFVE